MYSTDNSKFVYIAVTALRFYYICSYYICIYIVTVARQCDNGYKALRLSVNKLFKYTNWMLITVNPPGRYAYVMYVTIIT